MELKIASTDKPWLQQLVLSERRRLAGLHRAALINASETSEKEPWTETSVKDHEGDLGYAGALADKKEAPKHTEMKTSDFHPDNPETGQGDLEMINMAQEHLEGEYPEKDPQQIADILHQAWTPGISFMQLMSSAIPMMSHGMVAASTKKADTDPNTETAETDHKGDKNYEKALDPKYAKTNSKTASEVDVNKSGMPPNTNRATEDHDFELTALKRQIEGMQKKPDWNPNDMLLD